MKSIDAPLSRRDRSGFSIIELMIAIVISLIVLVVMMQAFKRASGEIKKGRSMIAMASEMRAVGETFRRDLANTTVSPRVWNLSSESNGYFEIIEGPQNDKYHADFYVSDGVDNDKDTTTDEIDEMGFGIVGDIDDVIAMTIRSGEKPFRGRWEDPTALPGTPPQIVESHVAEVVWFVVRQKIDDAIPVVDMDDRVTLYRRVLLVRPDLNVAIPSAPPADNSIDGFYRRNDISVRAVGANLEANTLSDLTLRENRYCHSSLAFPFALQSNLLANLVTPALDRRIPTGEDILLTNVAGFDIRVYSPNAPIKTPNAEQFIGPGDPNYVANAALPTDEGSYVDLGWSRAVTGISWFEEVSAIDRPPTPLTPSTWCSWSPHYEYNGVDDDGFFGPDQGTNGLDDDGDGLVDESGAQADGGEQEAPAPYARPLRAVQLTMRGIEKSTRNIRQVTITSSFVPE